MSKSIRHIGLAALLALACALASAAAPVLPGRPATAAEVAAWDTDVRADFKGLPKGSGSVSAGQQVWDAKCASCHGSFGESNEVFTPIIGGTTAEDIKTGRVAALKPGGQQPHRTTLMKLATVSTLWDYIKRAMPWTAPKTLTDDEVYAVTAYILNLGDIVPGEFVLSDKNIAEVQQRMPNRNGMVNNHGMWDIKGKPDVNSVACMVNCDPDARLRSVFPDAMRNAHGNLAQQQRSVGQTHGIDTSVPRSATAQAAMVPVLPAGLLLARQNTCLACHGINDKLVGPSFAAVGAKYRNQAGASEVLLGKIKKGSSGAWGAIPMPPQAQASDTDLKTIVGWLLDGAKQ
jgi:cytochrome c551/c552/cytochrome c553